MGVRRVFAVVWGRIPLPTRSSKVGFDRVAGLETQIQQLESRIAELQTTVNSGQAAFATHQLATAETVGDLVAGIVDAGMGIRNVEVTVRDLNAAADLRLKRIERRKTGADLRERVHAVTAWVQAAKVAEETLVSVIITTYRRPQWLKRAVESVQAQEYTRWQLIIVDDSSEDETAAVVEELARADERIVVVTQAHSGSSIGRNNGLATATGDIICYLDDDNLMAPLWLKAVVWAFDRHPDLEFAYGARICERAEGYETDQERLPSLQLEPWDRREMERHNLVDTSVLAHRNGMAEAYFDLHDIHGEDWEFTLRMSEDRTPLALPVVACIYSTSSPGRKTDTGNQGTSIMRIHSKMKRVYPVRVLAYNLLFPLLSETYVGTEMRALAANGAELAWATEDPTPADVKVGEPLYNNLEAAIAEFQPDLLFLHWLTHAEHSLPLLSRLHLPFAVRAHSMDWELWRAELIRDHPFCIGIWAYPHLARQTEGLHELVTLFDKSERAIPAAERPIVLSASASVPTRDWPTLVKAFATLAANGADCRIIVAVTRTFEDEPAKIAELIRESGAPVRLMVDIPHEEITDMLSRTSAVVYTMASDAVFGMPRSVIDGMCASTSVVLPDRPEARLVAGAGCRTYVTSDDIVGHVTEILAGGPTIDAEQAANREFALERFADPQLGTSFTAEVYAALGSWWGP